MANHRRPWVQAWVWVQFSWCVDFLKNRMTTAFCVCPCKVIHFPWLPEFLHPRKEGQGEDGPPGWWALLLGRLPGTWLAPLPSFILANWFNGDTDGGIPAPQGPIHLIYVMQEKLVFALPGPFCNCYWREGRRVALRAKRVIHQLNNGSCSEGFCFNKSPVS